MRKRVRCPCCAMLVWPSQIKKSHLIDIDVKNMSSLGRGKGFKFVDSEDSGLVELVKNKIKLLYERFFETTVLRVPTVPGVFLREAPRLDLVDLTPSLSFKGEVKMVG